MWERDVSGVVVGFSSLFLLFLFSFESDQYMRVEVMGDGRGGINGKGKSS